MNKDLALAELKQIRIQLDALDDAVSRNLEGAEEAAKEGPGSALYKLTEATPIDRPTLFKAQGKGWIERGAPAHNR
jgi:hypothetical protein